MNDTGKAVPDARSSDRDYVVPDSDKARRTDAPEVTIGHDFLSADL